VKIAVFKTDNGLEDAMKDAMKAVEWERHVKGKVFIKPNLCSKNYIQGAVTNPQVLFYMVGLLRDRVEEVIVGESNGYNYCCDDALTLTGVDKIVKKAGGKTVNLSNDETIKVHSPKTFILRDFPLPKTLVEADSLVDVPVMKTHEFTTYSGAIKNLFGCIPDDRRIFLHPNFDMVLYDLLVLLEPKLIVMDATTAMEGNGPSRGIAIPMNLLLASNDALATDKLCSEIMGIDWKEVNHLKFIDKHSEGGETEIIGEEVEALKRPFLTPYLDLAVRAQRLVYKSYFLTRLCFGTPFLKMLQGCLNAYRKVDEEIKGKKWVDRHWDNTLPR
jgi:uncharacterized protein (DUF362 family)